MMRWIILSACAGGALLTVLAGCADFDSAQTPDPGRGSGYNGAGGSGGGTDYEQNLGGTSESGFSYGHLCGRGCEVGAPCDGPRGQGGSGGGGDGGGGGAGGDASAVCSLAVDGRDDEVTATCQLAGASQVGDPCLDTGDCAPGLGCVDSGVCRPYCCGDLEGCPEQTYCAPRPMAAGDLPAELNEAPLIPVCEPVEDCVLLDDSSCPEGETCTIVRTDGTTSCVVPGEGEAGEPCQCAPGHVCNPNIDTCFEICRLDRDGDCPAGYTCQGGGEAYPDGFGICVQN